MIQVNNNQIVEELVKALEPMICPIIREELKLIAENQANIFYLDPGSPLYEDMMDIKRRKEKNELEFYSHKEVWDE